jgi:hypothetical protein
MILLEMMRTMNQFWAGSKRKNNSNGRAQIISSGVRNLKNFIRMYAFNIFFLKSKIFHFQLNDTEILVAEMPYSNKKSRMKRQITKARDDIKNVENQLNTAGDAYRLVMNEVFYQKI